MKKHMGMFLLAVLVVGVLLIGTVAYTVDELKDIVLIRTFGRVTKVIHGRDDPGLHFKWPWPVQKLVRYDARTFILDDPYGELETSDKQNVLVTMYAAWCIKDPKKFHSTIDTIAAAEKSIRARLHDHKSKVVSKHMLEEFASTDPNRMHIAEVEQEILDALQREVGTDYGVEIKSVGMRLLGLPEGVSAAVIEAQKKEREQYVQQYKTEGEALATAIRSRAERARKQILAFASAKAMKIKAEGDSAAARYYRQFAKNERLGMFLRSLESLRTGLKNKAVILLDDSQIPAIKYLRKGPSLPELPQEMPGAVPGAGTTAEPAPQTDKNQGK